MIDTETQKKKGSLLRLVKKDDAISSDGKRVILTINGDYSTGQLSWPIVRKTEKACLISTPNGTAWLPLSAFDGDEWQAKHIRLLVLFLLRTPVYFSGTIAVIPTDIKPTDKTRRYLVDVERDRCLEVVKRVLEVTLPESAVVEQNGLYHVHSSLMKRKLVWRDEWFIYSTRPVFAGMIAEIELLAGEILEIDADELELALIRGEAPPKVYGWTTAVLPANEE